MNESSIKRQLWLYYAALACMAAASGMYDSTFNNFLSDTFHLTADARGNLELPREMPGFLVVMMTGLLCMLPLTRVGVVGTSLAALGLAGMALFGGTYTMMVVMMFLVSTGQHLLQPVGTSVVLGLGTEHDRGARLGQAAGVATLFTALGTGSVWLLMDRVTPQYRTTFVCAAVVFGTGGLFYFLMHIPHLHAPRQRMVVRREFSLYYVLEFLAGARKQIFLTFGPWVLIRVYGLPAPSIAGLLMISSLVGIVFKPLAGMVMDRVGERTVMVLDGLVLAVVCLGYGYAQKVIPDPDWARRAACCCYIADEMLFALGNARSVYLSRMAKTPQELNSSLAMGVSINHIASMTIPMVAGLVWVVWGYERLFFAAALFGVVLAMVATRVPGRRRSAA